MYRALTLVGIVLLLLLSGPRSTYASIVYDWRGDCDGIIIPVRGGGAPNGCTGQATFHVTVAESYIPGTLVFESIFDPLDPHTLLSARYVDEHITFDFAPVFDGSFMLPADPSEGGVVQLEVIAFRSDAAGVWRMSGENLRPGCDASIDTHCVYTARGVDGTWTRVPAPATLVLLGLGIAAVVLRARRRSVTG